MRASGLVRHSRVTSAVGGVCSEILKSFVLAFTARAGICETLFRAEAARALFWRLKAKGHIMVGITSYQEYPGEIVNPYDDRHVAQQDAVIHNAMDAWLHCFRRALNFRK